AVEYLARVEARGGTEMAEPLRQGLAALTAGDGGAAVPGRQRDRVLVLITDGQVGNEDHILATLGEAAQAVRIFTLGIDQAGNAAFLRRLSDLGGGTSALVESEDRLDAVMDQTHRHIGTPVLTGGEADAAAAG